MQQEIIQQISNTNTINIKDLSINKPVSYAYLCLKNRLNNSGMELIFINQDKNRVYFKIKNNINKYITSIIDLAYNELLSMNNYILEGLKSNVWNKTI